MKKQIVTILLIIILIFAGIAIMSIISGNTLMFQRFATIFTTIREVFIVIENKFNNFFFSIFN